MKKTEINLPKKNINRILVWLNKSRGLILESG